MSQHSISNTSAQLISVPRPMRSSTSKLLVNRSCSLESRLKATAIILNRIIKQLESESMIDTKTASKLDSRISDCILSIIANENSLPGYDTEEDEFNNTLV